MGVNQTVNDLCCEYMRHEEKNLARSTFLLYLDKITKFVDACGDLSSADIRPIDVTRWITSHPKWGQSMQRQAITCAKRVFSWAKQQGLIDHDPLARMPRPGVVVRKNVLTAEQAKQVLNLFPENDPFRIFLCALHATGCRPGEVANLKAIDVDTDAGTWSVINKTRARTGIATRKVYLNSDAMEITRLIVQLHPTGLLFRNSYGGKWTAQALNMRFAKVRRILVLGREAVCYSYRHEYVTSALEKGVPIATVAELVGHANTRMISSTYSKLSERHKHLRDAAESVRGPSEPEKTPAQPRDGKKTNKSPGRPAKS